MQLDPTLVLVVTVGALVIYGVWRVAHPPWPIEIVVTPEGVRSQRGLPKRAVGPVIVFLEQDVDIESKVVIRAARDRNARLRIKMSGAWDAGIEQRIRNFLLAEL